MKKIWQIWKYSLGSFSDDKTAPYDNYVTLIRTIIFVSYMVTNTFILSFGFVMAISVLKK